MFRLQASSHLIIRTQPKEDSSDQGVGSYSELKNHLLFAIKSIRVPARQEVVDDLLEL